MTPLTDAELDVMAEQHYDLKDRELARPWCPYCHSHYPCDAARLVIAVREAREALRMLQERAHG